MIRLPTTPDRDGPDCVLVVDDEADILESLRDLLDVSLDNVKVYVAASGSKALEILAAERVDLIISDYKMPNMNGLEFLKQANKVSPGVPSILLTAFPDQGIAVQAINETGVKNFITKPFDPTEAVEAVAQILHHRRAEEEARRAHSPETSARGGF